MEHQENSEASETAADSRAAEDSGATPVTKRTPRMQHESSFATSGITSSGSSGSSRRPPGFVSSSLDYKVSSGASGSGSGSSYQRGSTSNAASSAVNKNYIDNNPDTTEKILNPKPAKRKMQQPTPEEQMEQEKQAREQQRQQKQSQHHLPTRSRGNYGPPPHKVSTFEDLELMTQEQLYQLIMEDPELYRSLIKSTDSSGEGASTSPPTGAKRARSNRSSGKKRSNLVSAEDKEVPYLQWCF
ncbi:MAG: hypothetical protein SGILL_010130, partial [Bacillariaceae sp.]